MPEGLAVRPTSDKVKQALFNILGDRTGEAAMLDLFAGAGGIGIEALSRGARRVVFVDASRESCAAIKQNVAMTGTADRAQVVQTTAESFLKNNTEAFDIVFLDPPYVMEQQPLLEVIAASGSVQGDTLVIAEHFKKQRSPERAGSLVLYREARYGDTVLAFYEVQKQESGASSQKSEVEK